MRANLLYARILKRYMPNKNVLAIIESGTAPYPDNL